MLASSAAVASSSSSIDAVAEKVDVVVNDATAMPPTPTTTGTTSRFANPFNVKEKLMNKASQAIGNGIKGMYSKLESEGFSAGEEFVVAVREGLSCGSDIVLGDQDVEVTLRRLTEALSKTDLKKLLLADSELEESMKQFMPPAGEAGSMTTASSSSSISSSSANINNDGGMSKEQLSYFVETVKAKENVRLLMGNFERISPELYGALVRERDLYMAGGIDRLNQFDSMVAVMGIAHVDGVENALRERGWVEAKHVCSSA